MQVIENKKDCLSPSGSAHRPPRAGWSVVPIRSLGFRHRAAIERHLLALKESDRYLRFGYMATDDQIRRYVAGLDFLRDDFFGIFNRKLELIAVSHLAISGKGARRVAEFGVSVSADARGRGYGGRLFQRAARHTRNAGVPSMYIHALAENSVMLRIARRFGARVERDGSEVEAWLTVPAPTLDTRLSEIVEDHFGQLDYRYKGQAKLWRRWVAMGQQWRRQAGLDWRSATLGTEASRPASR